MYKSITVIIASYVSCSVSATDRYKKGKGSGKASFYLTIST